MDLSIETYIWARALHLVGIVIWLGGVFFVTVILLPSLKDLPAAERLPAFSRLEHRFSWFARFSLILVTITGLLLAEMIGLWQRMSEPQLWPVHLMLTLTLIFAIILFIVEPLFGKRVLEPYAQRYPDRAFRLASIIHWVLTIISLFTIIVGTLLAHGYTLAP